MSVLSLAKFVLISVVMPGFFDPTTTPPTSVTFRCNFEDGTDPTCGWTQSFRDGFDWTWYAGPSRDYNSGPESDHTKQNDDGSFFIFIFICFPLFLCKKIIK